MKRNLFQVVCFLLKVLIFCFFFHPLTTWGQLPSWVESVEYNVDFKPSQVDLAQGYVYLMIDEQVNIPLQEVYYHSVVRVSDEVGLSAASQINMVFNSSFQTLRFTHISVIRQGQTINILKSQKPEIIRREANLEQDIIDGEETAFLKIQGVNVGDIIDYGVVIQGFNPAKQDFFYNSYYLGYSTCVGKINVFISTNSSQNYDFQLHNTELKPIIKKKGKNTTFNWLTINPGVINVEADAPAWYNPYPSVDFFKKKSWHDVNEYAQSFFQLKKPLSPELIAWVRTVKQLSVSQDDAVLTLIHDVQNQVRYLGVETGENGLKPRHPNEIFQNKAGDCKEKSWLLSVALQHIGVKAFPVFVNTVNGHTLSRLSPSLDAFNHCVVCIVQPSDTIWIDPTISNQGGDLKSTSFPNYEFGLVINGKGKGLSAIKPKGLIKTEVFERFMVTSFYDPISFEVETIYEGIEADNQRSIIKSQSARQLQLQYLKFYAEMYPKIDTLSSFKVIDNLKQNQLIIKEDYQISNLWYAPDSLKPQNLRADFYPLSLKYYLNHETHVNRKSPLFQRFPLDYQHHIQVTLPESWNLSGEQKSINGKGYSYSRTVNFQNNKLDLNYHYKTSTAYIAVEDYSRYIEQHEKIVNDLSYSLTYGESLPNSDQKGINILFWVITLFVLVIAIFAAHKIYYYNPEVMYCYEKEKRIMNGWVLFLIFVMGSLVLWNFIQFFSSNYWDTQSIIKIYNPASPQYNALLGWFLILKFVLTLAILVFAFVILLLMVKRRSSVSQLVIIYFVVRLGIDIMVYVVAGFSGEQIKAMVQPPSKAYLFLIVCLTVVFVQLFSSSRMLKEAFNQRLVMINSREKQTEQNEVEDIVT